MHKISLRKAYYKLKKLAFFLGSLVLLADITTKYLIHRYIPLMHHGTMEYPYSGIGFFENFLGIEFSIVHTTNRGAAWGILAQYQGFLLGLRIILVNGLLGYLVFFNKRSRWVLPLTLIIVGALGNILDYFIYGHVVDFFHFVFWGYDYPVFNLADTAICIGIGWLFFSSLTHISHKEKT